MMKAWLLLLLIGCCTLAFAQNALEVPQPMVDSLQSTKTFAYANDPSYWQTEITEPSFIDILLSKFLSARLFRTLLIVLLAALLVYIFIRMLLQNRLQLFTSKGARLKKEAELLPQEIDYHLFIADAEQRADFRSAIRFQFLATLTRLKEGNWIQWRVDGTNRDYLEQVKKQKWQPSFLQLTRLFERVWYGSMPVAADEYQQFRQLFVDFNKQLP